MGKKERLALIGGGPTALFVYKRLVESQRTDISVDIFERKERLGQGMPYSSEGANLEHITNVSESELPDLVVPLTDWVQALPQEKLDLFGLKRQSVDAEKVLPRLLFGEYLEAQFHLLVKQGSGQGLATKVHLNYSVLDLRDRPESGKVEVIGADGTSHSFDRVIICTGHKWPQRHEGDAPGFFASPYPPSKLARCCNHPVALRGSSLTAVDAIRTLARANGQFQQDQDGRLAYRPNSDSQDFSMVMHTRSGMLPCVRFHLEDPQVDGQGLLGTSDLTSIRQQNGGFVPLDLIFEHDFKGLLRDRDPDLYQRVREATLEQFVAMAMEPRQKTDPFLFFRKEIKEAQDSVEQQESVHWKEALAILSFALNYPAKHFSAEDMQRMKRHLSPLISLVIAFVPSGSYRELLALHEAGRLDLVPVGADSSVERAAEGGILYHFVDDDGASQCVPYQTFVDCVGQPHLPLNDFPFPGLLEQGVVCQARLPFRSQAAAKEALDGGDAQIEQDPDGTYHLVVPGIAINDSFQPVGRDGAAHPRIHILAVPYIGGHNPDYSGLDFCEEASLLVLEAMKTPCGSA